MPTPKQDKQNDALVMVSLRNQFYQSKFYLVLSIYLVSLLVIGFLVGVVIYLVKHPTHPLYFVTDNVSRLIQDVPKDRPNMPSEEVLRWTVEAVEAAYSYDFVNYRVQLQNVQKYFTDYGWRNYMEGLRSSNNLLALTQRKFVIIAKIVETPKLVAEGLVGGAFAWKYQMNLLLTYLFPPYDDKSKFQNPVHLTVVVQRQSILSSDKGLGIVQMIGNLAVNLPTNSLAPPATAE